MSDEIAVTVVGDTVSMVVDWAIRGGRMKYSGCRCEACQLLPNGVGHHSDCSVHNEPAYPKESCDCVVAAALTPGDPE